MERMDALEKKVIDQEKEIERLKKQNAVYGMALTTSGNVMLTLNKAQAEIRDSLRDNMERVYNNFRVLDKRTDKPKTH